MAAQPKAWSLWIYDRHCCLVFHADWSDYHASKATHKPGQPSASGGLPSGGTGSRSKTGALPLAEQAKLVYGLVFSLRNMTRKLSPYAGSTSSEQQSLASQAARPDDDTLHSFSTATYTLSHVQTATRYTFVLITDPVPPPTRRPPPMSSGGLLSSATAATFSGGGGIPATGGMTTTGVLQQITRGPWLEFVARNAGCMSLERATVSDDEEEEEEQDRDLLFGAGEKLAADGTADGGQGDTSALGTVVGDTTAAAASQVDRRQRKQNARNEILQKALHRQRLKGLGASIDSEAFRAAVERGELKSAPARPS